MQPDAPQNQPPRKKRNHRLLLILIVLVLAIVILWGILSRVHDKHVLKKNTDDQAILSVTVIQPKQQAMMNEIVLPGSVQAWHDASLSARVGGYLKTWNKDIGDHVKAGDVLATIDTPETDAQLNQALADLKLAVANNDLAQITAKRWLALLKTDSVTRQETDQNVANARAMAANVQSQMANVNRLRDLESFKSIIAPFDGVVTNRATDIGALINANGGELYHVSTIDKLRVYVQIPQNYTELITPDIQAEMTLDDHPAERFPIKLLSTAGSLNAATRTLLAEFTLPNPAGRLFPGGYAQVHIQVPDQDRTMRLPVNAFIFQTEGLQVATVDRNNHVQIKSVKPGRDFGTAIEVLAGIADTDRIIINPPDSVYNDEPVRIAPAPKQDGGETQQKADDDEKKQGDTSNQTGQKTGQKTGTGEQKNKDPNTKDDSQ
jgi:RND family efflux transporter MFP subunit